MFGPPGAAPSMSLRTAMPCQCTDVGCSRRLARVTASSSPTLARISGPGTPVPWTRVRANVPPRSTVAGSGVNDAVTVRPVCGRAASAAAMAAAMEAVWLAAGLVERPQAASANPPVMAAATNVRRLSSIRSNGDSVIMAPSSLVRAARRRSPRFGEPHRSRSLIAGVAVDWSPRRAVIVAVTLTVIVVLLLAVAG